MQEVIINCKSKRIYKTILNLKCKSKYKFQNLICRFKTRKSNKNIVKFKLRKITEQSINCKSKLKFTSSILKFKLKHNILLYKLKEYNIKNNIIIEDIDTFYDIAKHYVELFSYQNQMMIIDIEDATFIVLKAYENQIESIQHFRTFNINKMFTKELIFKIQYK